jgi:crossover junction endodeoxyribonuclease RusA
VGAVIERVRIGLPWSKPPLSLNDRSHWRAKAARTAQVRADMAVLVRQARIERGAEHVVVELHYRPRDNRRRDTDNLVATLKPICDELAGGTTKHPGFGLVPDDTPAWMSKPEPTIHPAIKGEPGELWLWLTITRTTPTAQAQHTQTFRASGTTDTDHTKTIPQNGEEPKC